MPSHDPFVSGLNALMRKVIGEINEAEVASIKQAPDRHKLTRFFDPGVSTSYRYCEDRNGAKARKHIRWCRATSRNAAGYFLVWREVDGKDKNGRKFTKRDRFAAYQSRTSAAESIRRAAGWKKG